MEREISLLHNEVLLCKVALLGILTLQDLDGHLNEKGGGGVVGSEKSGLILKQLRA